MTTAPATPLLPSVGQRFSQSSSRGTVRFVGPVSPTTGIWLGVEWDEAGRGKHDGVHSGQRYFTCRVPGAGSFLRPTAKISYGSSFLKALKDKYVAPYLNAEAKEAPVKYSRRNLAEIEVEMPNMDVVAKRTKNLAKLRDVGLGGWRSGIDDGLIVEDTQVEVACAYDEEEVAGSSSIAATCPNVRSLDLSRSLIPTWKELSRITVGLAYLDTLVLHFNRFAEFGDDSGEGLENKGFHKIQDLRLDGCLLTWGEIERLGKHFPNLETLQLGSNGIASLERSKQLKDTSTLARLRTLNLEGNELRNWSEVAEVLGRLPSLERLIIASNKISTIGPPQPNNDGTFFPSLRHISLIDNPIAKWSDLENLDRWVTGGLRSLVVGGDDCPLTKDFDAKDLRPLIVARLGRLEHLNGAEIKPVERRDAELFYLSTIQKENLGAPNAEQHPRAALLMEKHGVKVSAHSEPQETGTLRSKLLTLRVHLCHAPPSSEAPHLVDHVFSAENVELLTTVPLRALRTKLARSVNLQGGARAIGAMYALLATDIDEEQATAKAIRDEMRPDERTLRAVGSKESQEDKIVYEMDEAGKDLLDYNLSKGDEIVIVAS